METSSKPVVCLSEVDGNAFSIVGACRKAAKRANMKNWEEIQKEMMSGDYDNLLQTAMKYFEVE